MNDLLKKQFWMNNLWYGENSRRTNIVDYGTDLFLGAEELLTRITPDMQKVWGIDISHWNGLTDLYTAKMMGCSFVVIKAADGSVKSKWFPENKQRAKDVELPWGAYVWLYPDKYVSVQQQVNTWWELFQNDYPPVGVHIDFEWTRYAGQAANPNAGDLRKALDLFEQKSGGTLAEVYTAKGYADEYLIGFQNPGEYKWWIANYGVNTPNMPRLLVQERVPWKKWQFTATLDGDVIAPSGNRELDGNYYAGDYRQFAAEYLQSGGTMPKYYRWNSNAANIRSGPGTSYPDKGDLVRDDVIQVDDAKTGSWFPFKIAQHSDGSYVTLTNGTKLDGTQADKYWATDSYFVEVSSLPSPLPDPDPDPDPDPTPTTHVVEVFIDGVLEYRKELQ